jgi:hypothetical protein
MSIKIYKILIVVLFTFFVIDINSQAVGQQRGSQSEKQQAEKTLGPIPSLHDKASEVSYQKYPLNWAVNEARSLIGLPTMETQTLDHYGHTERVGSDRADRFKPMALSAGNSATTSWVEGWLRGYGQARFSLNLDRYGHYQGYAELLVPLYDSEQSSFFSQIGFRTMPNDRVIGNLGLGQRWLLGENTALGGNLFLDYDFTRSNLRSGAGFEFWADWFRLASNYYFPLADWKGSKDYKSTLIQERPGVLMPELSPTFLFIETLA